MSYGGGGVPPHAQKERKSMDFYLPYLDTRPVININKLLRFLIHPNATSTSLIARLEKKKNLLDTF